MAAHLRRFSDMHPAAILVALDLSESTVLREEEDRCVHGGHSLREFGSPTRIAVLRHSYAHSAD